MSILQKIQEFFIKSYGGSIKVLEIDERIYIGKIDLEYYIHKHTINMYLRDKLPGYHISYLSEHSDRFNSMTIILTKDDSVKEGVFMTNDYTWMYKIGSLLESRFISDYKEYVYYMFDGKNQPEPIGIENMSKLLKQMLPEKIDVSYIKDKNIIRLNILKLED